MDYYNNDDSVANVEFVPVIQPLVIDTGYQNDYQNGPDYALIAVIASLIVVFCLACLAIYSMVGIGCYMAGKSHKNDKKRAIDGPEYEYHV